MTAAISTARPRGRWPARRHRRPNRRWVDRWTKVTSRGSPAPAVGTGCSPLAKPRGRNWGLPGATPRATGIVRPIRVALLPDRLIILPDRGEADVAGSGAGRGEHGRRHRRICLQDLGPHRTLGHRRRRRILEACAAHVTWPKVPTSGLRNCRRCWTAAVLRCRGAASETENATAARTSRGRTRSSISWPTWSAS